MRKKILVLGGTMFVGRALVEKLLALPQYDVTIFNRGKSNAGIFTGAKQIHGNRETDDILQVCSQHWDCIIDFCGYYPLTFENFLEQLRGRVSRYIFISTISVYDLSKFSERAITEVDEIVSCAEEQKISKLPEAYGEKKAEMERILLKQKWLDKIILRPSFIYGKYDWTDRFYYWLYRAKFFETILLPQEFNLSLTYADDLVYAILNTIEVENHQEVYNAISQTNIFLRNIVDTASSILNKTVSFVEVTNEELEKNQIDTSSFPLFVPLNFSVQGKNWLNDFSIKPEEFIKAVAETILYYGSLGWPVPRVGLSIVREKEILGI